MKANDLSTSDQKNTWAGPLDGLRVIDLTRVLAGPFCTMSLGDLGAEVLKIEPPDRGDETRHFPPFIAGESHYFLGINRNKKSLVIDLQQPKGAEILRKLVASADIVVENYRPGVMDRLGLGYDALAEINPRLIYCAISGFGLSGPLRDKPSFDIVTQALSGALSINGERGHMPVKLGIPLGDMVGGVFGPMAILAALHERHATGRGRLIDISLHDGLIGMLGYFVQLAFITGQDPGPMGSSSPEYRALWQLPGLGRLDHHRGVVGELLGQIVRRLGAVGPRDRSALRDADRATRPPRRGRCRDRRDHSHPHRRRMGRAAREIRRAARSGARRHRGAVAPACRGARDGRRRRARGDRRMQLAGRPVKFPGLAAAAGHRAAAMGQHTAEVLRDLLGYSDAEIHALRRDGVIDRVKPR